MSIQLFNHTNLKCSRIITTSYSTSFSLGIRSLSPKFRDPIYAIYGFVRFADEIVDTFHEHDKIFLLEKFKNDTFEAIDHKISLNPVLHSFQWVVHKYGIEKELIEAFLHSMEMDLNHKIYNNTQLKEYIYGSAEVVGLMCLKVFCEGDTEKFGSLKDPAKSLGSAFQKVNFLRDLQSDYVDRGRIYFPQVDFSNFTDNAKKQVEQSIEKEFKHAFKGIIHLPKGAKLGVYLAYIYYTSIFRKIKELSPSSIKEQRVRIPDGRKLALLLETYLRSRLNYF